MHCRTLTYKTVEDCRIYADAYGVRSGAAQPVVLYLHGGALIGGSRKDARASQVADLVADGYVVVSVDYRLAPETKLAAIIEDIRDAARWVREHGPGELNIDPARMAVMGGSAGGYLTLMTGFCLDQRPRCLVSFYGYGDIVGPWYSRPDPFYCAQPAVPQCEAFGAVGRRVVTDGGGDRFRFYLYCRQHGIWPVEVAGYNPDGERERFTAFCPDRNVTSEYPPTILFHGDADTDVPYALSARMADRLAACGVEHELITIPGGGHGCDGAPDDPAVHDALARIRAFLRNHLAA